MRTIVLSLWLRKLTGKPAFLTVVDSESDTPRILLTEHEGFLPVPAAESNVRRIESELDWHTHEAIWTSQTMKGNAL
jgi:hypothetical protein